ncbi:MAG: Cof-type HAD-IIB family hydrolase [Clostridia bacterium]|nr:Cof-type HAD-IIB family hydrolase [Clostridia bacterium]
MIRLIVTDLDDTLLDEQGRLPKQNALALEEAARRGAIVTVATGRMTAAAMPFVHRLGVRAPVIFYNGALVYDPAQNRASYERSIPLSLAREILRRAEELGLYIQYFDRNGYFFARRCGYTSIYGKLIGVSGRETGAPLSEWIADGAMKLLIVTEEGQRDGVCECFRQEFGDRVHVMGTRRGFVEIVAKGVDKGEALRALAAELGVEREDVAAFGDAQNDVGMIGWAGHGCCVENGCDAAKAAARHIAPSNARCGVSVAIRNWMDEGLL